MTSSMVMASLPGQNTHVLRTRSVSPCSSRGARDGGVAATCCGLVRCRKAWGLRWISLKYVTVPSKGLRTHSRTPSFMPYSMLIRATFSCLTGNVGIAARKRYTVLYSSMKFNAGLPVSSHVRGASAWQPSRRFLRSWRWKNGRGWVRKKNGRWWDRPGALSTWGIQEPDNQQPHRHKIGQCTRHPHDGSCRGLVVERRDAPQAWNGHVGGIEEALREDQGG